MKQVIIPSDNPVKIAVAEAAFKAVFPEVEFEFIGRKTASGVPDQPFGDDTLLGAMNRLEVITREHPFADYWISQEGGLIDDGITMYNRAWIVIADAEGHFGQSSTPSFEIPTAVAKLVREGNELGTAYDIHFQMKDSKRRGSGLSKLTDGLIDRKRYYLDAAIIALCQVKNHHWYT